MKKGAEKHKLPQAERETYTYFMKQVRKYPLLTREEEIQLAHERDNGNSEAAIQKFVVSNLRLVAKIAWKYHGRGVEIMDLIQEGTIGLRQAARKFDPTFKCRFSTYSSWWIRQSIQRALIDQSRTVRIPIHMSEQINKVMRAVNQLHALGITEPTNTQIAEITGMPEEKVRKAQNVRKTTLSLDAPIQGDENNGTMIEFLEDESAQSPEEEIYIQQAFDIVMQEVNQLDPRDLEMFERRVGFNGHDEETLEKIGSSYGLSRERIRQVTTKIKKTIRKKVLTSLSAEEV